MRGGGSLLSGDVGVEGVEGVMMMEEGGSAGRLVWDMVVEGRVVIDG